MTDQEKLNWLIAKRELLEERKEDLEGEIIDLEDEISEIESEERENPISVAKRQAEWDALPEEQKRYRQAMSDLAARIMLRDLEPSRFVNLARGLGQWIAPSQDPDIPSGGS